MERSPTAPPTRRGFLRAGVLAVCRHKLGRPVTQNWDTETPKFTV